MVECAAASGLGLVKEAKRDAWAASTYGTGELIAAAVEAGASSVLVAVGGSATTDGGAGAIEALKEAGVEPRMEVLCDVRTPFEDAARVFGAAEGRRPGDGEAAVEAPHRARRRRAQGPARRADERRRGRARRRACGRTSARSWCRARPTCSTRSASTRRCAPPCSWSPARAAWTASRWPARPRARWPPAAASPACRAARWWARSSWTSSSSGSSTWSVVRDRVDARRAARRAGAATRSPVDLNAAAQRHRLRVGVVAEASRSGRLRARSPRTRGSDRTPARRRRSRARSRGR